MRFSFIIPVYNNSDNISLCIKNITDQHFKDYEIIIVDDASNDQTAKSIKKLNNDKIICIHNSKNFGPGISRNRGLDKASGDFIIFMDCDDRIETNILTELDLHISENNNIDIFITKYIDISDNKSNNILFDNNIINHSDLKMFSLKRSYFINTCWYMIYSKDYLSFVKSSLS